MEGTTKLEVEGRQGGAVPTEGFRQAVQKFGILVLVTGVLFGSSLSRLITFALEKDLYSHVLLVPAIAIYMFVMRRSAIRPREIQSAPGWAGAFAGLALFLLSALWSPRLMAAQDRLFFLTTAFSLLIVASAFFCFGTVIVRKVALPLGLLVFLAPLPIVVERGFEGFLQHASAEVAAFLFAATGTPLLRDGLTFTLPNIVLQVAPECSGIRSTLVLLITGIVAGGLFLRSFWARALLAAAVIVLGIVRNGLRIVTIGLLCVHVDPSMIDSWVHRKGGPLFFAISLVGFFAVLLLLMRYDPPRRGCESTCA